MCAKVMVASLAAADADAIRRDGSRTRVRLHGLILTLAITAAAGLWPPAASAATCSDFRNQAEAQRAADSRDTDGDGIYCESLPCPCEKPGEGSADGGATRGGTSETSEPQASCTRTRGVVRLNFAREKYPEIRGHYLAAVKKGWPRVLVLNRPGADARRDRLLDDAVLGLPTRDGYDRDEYPPAVGRGRGPKSLRRGTDPVGWKASVGYVRSSENRAHGSAMGAKLSRFCNGQRFRYLFR